MNIMKPSMQTPELMSALADGQLGREDFVAALQVCQRDESAFSSWNTYHLIGDALRSPGRAPAPLVAGADLRFVNRLSQRLAQESVISAEPSFLASAPAAEAEGIPSSDLIH